SFSQNHSGEEITEVEDIIVEKDDDEILGSNTARQSLITNEKDTDTSYTVTKKIQNYYLRILFYAFLSKETNINSLSDVINTYENNHRLAYHLGIKKNVLEELDKTLKRPTARGSLDNKISNANALLVDNSIEPSDKVSRAIRSFKRISESE